MRITDCQPFVVHVCKDVINVPVVDRKAPPHFHLCSSSYLRVLDSGCSGRLVPCETEVDFFNRLSTSEGIVDQMVVYLFLVFELELMPL